MVDVVVAILRRSDGRILMARRPQGKPHAGAWEFPGGKVEAGEGADEALERELVEELGIVPIEPRKLRVDRADYPDGAAFSLHLHLVNSWRGEPQPLAADEIAWLLPAELPINEIIAGSRPLCRWIAEGGLERYAE